jgi:vacuolar-type H+-ATPase subunit I/STV1
VSKTDKDKARKELQRQRYMETARHALDEAIHRLEDTASFDAECVLAAEEAMHEAAKYETRCEALAALVAIARSLVEQARAAEAERARVAAQVAAAEARAAAVAEMESAAAAERMQLEERRAELAERQAELALEMQQMDAQLGAAAPTAPAPQAEAEEVLCVVCMDAPKWYAMVPCMHMCACEACAQLLTQTTPPTCPVCRVYLV